MNITLKRLWLSLISKLKTPKTKSTNSKKLLGEKTGFDGVDFSSWDGLDRRKTCQGCSSVYSKLLKSEKLNISSHKELFDLYQKKLSKRDFTIAMVIISFLFFLSFKFRNDFELRYINSLEIANKSIQEVIYNLKDLINSIDTINKRIIFNEEGDTEKEIKLLQKNLDDTQKVLKILKNQIKKGSKNENE